MLDRERVLRALGRGGDARRAGPHPDLDPSRRWPRSWAASGGRRARGRSSSRRPGSRSTTGTARARSRAAIADPAAGAPRRVRPRAVGRAARVLRHRDHGPLRRHGHVRLPRGPGYVRGGRLPAAAVLPRGPRPRACHARASCERPRRLPGPRHLQRQRLRRAGARDAPDALRGSLASAASSSTSISCIRCGASTAHRLPGCSLAEAEAAILSHTRRDDVPGP